MKKLSHSGNILIVLFCIMLVLMSILVYKSATQEVSMVSKDYYEQELKYQEKLDARNNTRSWDHLFALSKTQDSIRLTLPAVLSSTLEQGKAYFYCPSNALADTVIYLDKSNDGNYTFGPGLLKGFGYIVKIDLETNGRSYYKEIKLP